MDSGPDPEEAFQPKEKLDPCDPSNANSHTTPNAYLHTTLPWIPAPINNSDV